MAKKKTARKAPVPRSFTGVIRGRDASVQKLARALRDLLYEELPDAEESFYGGKNPMAMYRTAGEVCWIQPFTRYCNLYFTRGTDLSDPDGLLRGTSDRARHVQIRRPDDVDRYPLREWLQESVELNAASIAEGTSFDDALARLREIALALPNTRETETWGKPHFRVEEKIFCGCGESNGRVSLGLKAEPGEADLLMKLPGITKAAYSRPGDGWIAVDPGEFDDWDEIQRLVVGSFRLIAPKRLLREHGI